MQKFSMASAQARQHKSEVLPVFTDGGADFPTAVHTLLLPVNGAPTMAPVRWFSPCEMCTVGSSLQTGGNWGPQIAECRETLLVGQGFLCR